MQSEEGDDDAAPASTVRQRYDRMFKERKRADTQEGGADPSEQDDLAKAAARTAFQGCISTVFAKHLRRAPPYVQWSLLSKAFVKGGWESSSDLIYLP